VKRSRFSFDPRVWLAWVLTAAAVSTLTRNPLYLVVLLLVLAVVDVSCAAKEQAPLPWSPWRMALVVLPLTALFNALMVHAGQTILLRLPAGWPVVGGIITLEALIYGAINGLALVVLFAAFSTLNRVAPVHQLVQLAPRAFHELGVVVLIALTFLPQMSRAISQVRQAQAIRGHRPRGLRDWLPIILPLMITGLERAMGLAEAMVARGYGSVSGREHDFRLRLGLVSGLLALLVGWVLRVFWIDGAVVGLALMLAGGALLLGLIWWAGRRVRYSRYRPRRWTWADTLALLGCAWVMLVLALGSPTLNYYPYPKLAVPPFDPFLGLGLLGLLAPALLGRVGRVHD